MLQPRPIKEPTPHSNISFYFLVKMTNFSFIYLSCSFGPIDFYSCVKLIHFFSGKSKANMGWSALHLATYFGHNDVVKALLDVSLPFTLFISYVFSSPVGNLCHTRGIVQRPAYVICVHHNYQK